MPTQPRSTSEHYAESLRLLAVAEDAAVDPGIRDLAARMATAHAILTTAPRRARKRASEPSRHSDGLPPHLTWGDDS